MAIRNIRRQATNPQAAPGTPDSAPIYVDSDDNILKMIPAGSGTTEVQIVDASSVQTLTNKTFTAPTISGDVDISITTADTAETDQSFTLTSTQSSTSGSTSYEPFLVTTTLNGAGQVGGRGKFKTTFSAALGGWANALKAEVAMDADGSVSGLGSAFVAEMTLPAAALSAGTYGVVEVELNCPTSWSGTVPVSLFYCSVNGNTADNFHDNGYLFDLQGLGSATTGEIFQANTAADATHALRIRIGATPYYIMLTSAGA